MGIPQFCTQMVIDPKRQAFADSLAVKENPLNGHQITTGRKGMFELALPVGNMWKTGRTLRVKILNGSEKIRTRIKEFGSVWTKYANIKFEWVNQGDAEIRINVDASGRSWSYVGTDNLSIVSTDYTMNFGWLTDATSDWEFSRVIVHEFGHALGCIHEHQSPGAEIPWNKEAVLAYYAQGGWSPDMVENNIFRLYRSTVTQFSAFDPRSIMLYRIPPELTTNGFSTEWNAELSETDKEFIAGAYPTEGLDIASFNTMEVRQWDQPEKNAAKRQNFRTPFDTPPNLALGLNWLDIDNGANIRVRAFADNITTASANVHINTWADTTLYSAGCTWFTASNRDPDLQVGQFSTEDDHVWNKPQEKTSRRIDFTRPYAEPPKVVVWLNNLDIDRNTNWRVKATATDVDARGFTLHLDTWADTILYAARAAWIAYPANKAGVVSGSYSTEDLRPWHQPRLDNAGEVKFPAGKLQDNPTVLIGLSSLDISHFSNLRLKLSADSVSKDGMNWHIDSWSNTILFAAGANYIAFNKADD